MNRPPNSKVNLDRAIQRLYGTGARFVEYRSIIANTIVGQFLPNGVVKGGSALKLRYGCQATRMTTDFDTAYRTNIDQFIEDVRSPTTDLACNGGEKRRLGRALRCGKGRVACPRHG